MKKDEPGTLWHGKWRVLALIFAILGHALWGTYSSLVRAALSVFGARNVSPLNLRSPGPTPDTRGAFAAAAAHCGALVVELFDDGALFFGVEAHWRVAVFAQPLPLDDVVARLHPLCDKHLVDKIDTCCLCAGRGPARAVHGRGDASAGAR